jgi:signal transduction histidine kinase
VQEALTNAVKHAGPDAAVRVRIHHSPAGVSLQIRDNGKSAPASPTGWATAWSGCASACRRLWWHDGGT